jgi:predicted acyltransferase
MKPAPPHLDALDLFRGLAIASMIVVNNPGDWDAVFPALEHAGWNRVSFADFVFPSFIFIMGVAMPFAFGRRLENTPPGFRTYLRIGSRAIILIAIGLLLNAAAGFPTLSALRIPGVLQRIAMVYLLTALVVLCVKSSVRPLVAALLFLTHWAVLTLVPFDHHAGGVVSPQQNISAFMDAWLFGAHRLMPLDPEGALGTISATGLALLGVLAGGWLRVHVDQRRRILGLATGGIALMGLGLVWSRVLPLNKPLWTGSFSLVTGGAAALALAACFVAVEVAPVRKWTRPFMWLGVNPLAIYGLSELTGHLMDQAWVASDSGPTTTRAWLFSRLLEPGVGASLSRAGASMMFAVGIAALWISVAGVLDRQGIRVRV